MASMREIKLRIKSIRETRQITKAMKLIAAVNLKKAKQQLEQAKPFFDKVKETMADILSHSGEIENIFFDVRGEIEEKKRAYVILTGDKGLAGGYNANVIKLSEKHIGDKKDSLLLVAGHMGRAHFTRNNYNVDEEFDFPVQNPTVYRAREITAKILELFRNREVDEVYMVNTQMISSLSLEPHIMKLLPLELEEVKKELKVKKENNHNPATETKIDSSLSYEPSPNAVFDVLIPKYVKGIVYGELVESFTSEQSARMTAMDSATANADEMLVKMNLFYNRARQAAITQEISEIVGGAAVLD